ncbi:VWA domain-containing protein [Tenacibaculum sp. UWU-22]|uniref:VWA domain-containing protein n=1 Tax=Tenacibaculum sp. UWU-22 TaxID=3234187 RepID=UPI0034DB40F6
MSVLVDNSLSIPYFKQTKPVVQWVQNLKANQALNDKFDIHYFSFGKNTQVLDSLLFTDSQTNISQALQSVNKLYKNNLGAILLVSDGNQTLGNNYEFVKSKQPVFPIVVGDTTMYSDVQLSQLNVNKYSYVNNKFPVEALLYYDGKKPVTTRFTIYKNEKLIYTQKVTFSANKHTQTIVANIKANEKGLQYYTASIKKIENEKNIKNNTKSFSVEVIDQQSKILLLASFLHPDVGALKKAIEQNKQRVVTLKINDFKNIKLDDYQLIILYQPTSNFGAIFNELTKQNKNYFVISGTKTDWNFLNKIQTYFTKKAINQSENYSALYNDKFLPFFQKNIGFENFPPLKDRFGALTLKTNNQPLLYQKIGGINSDIPLLVTFENNDQRLAALFGEGLWQWRAVSYRNEQLFGSFDDFIGNLVQYLVLNKKRSRLEVYAENLYPVNATVSITAFYTDENYQFDNRASLLLTLTNTATKKQKTIPFSLLGNKYQVDLENLLVGNYTYKVTVNNKNIHYSGRFKIIDYPIEEQFTNANKRMLKKIADKTGGKLFFLDQEKILTTDLHNNTSFYTTQKLIKKEQNLIDWKWILFLAVFLLSLEWFIRKYYGKI